MNKTSWHDLKAQIKIHTSTKEYCKCKKHPRKFKKKLSELDRKFCETMDKLTRETEELGLYDYPKEDNELL